MDKRVSGRACSLDRADTPPDPRPTSQVRRLRGTGARALARRLGVGDAVVIGLGSMIGAGVFAAFGPAARAAGTGLLVGLGIAAVIAYCNATASAQLAAAYPTSGGTYIYGRERLGHWWGFAAGWGFVVGKTASCAAMALTFATYAVPGPSWAQRAVAVAAVLALASLNYRGVTKTVLLTRVLVATSLTALAVVVVGIAVGRPRRPGEPGRLAGPGHRRSVRHPPGGRPAVLRVRRLRPNRDHGRGGPRSAAHHPPGHPDRLVDDRGRLPGGGGGGAAGCRSRSARRRRRSADGRGAGGRCGWARPGRAGRRGVGRARRVAGPDRRCRPHQPGHGPPPGPARLAGRRALPATGFRTMPNWPSRSSSASWWPPWICVA